MQTKKSLDNLPQNNDVIMPGEYHRKGRPPKYNAKLIPIMLQYFSRPPYERGHDGKLVPSDLPTFKKFAADNNFSPARYDEWRRVSAEFRAAYEKCKAYQEHFLLANSLRGLYQQSYAIFTAKNLLGWRDINEVSHSGCESVLAKNVAKKDVERL